MHTKLIFFDIDGTLLDEKTGTVPDSTIHAIQTAQKNGHLCFINTGRPISTIDSIITDIPFDGYICGCGTYIQYHNQTLFHAQLDDKLKQKVINAIEKYQLDAMLEGSDGVYFSQHLKHPFIQTIQKHYQKLGFHVGDFSHQEIVSFDKLTTWYQPDTQIDAFKQALQNDFHIIQRDVDFLEIVPLPYSKATGIQYLVDHLGYTLKDTISIGDSTNDLPMLTYTHESVAMGNSNPILFDKVSYITTNIDQNGIENALKHFQIIS
ncbi:Cof-type HAD-IIB family hydrolase [Allocoprobacillus halotolerans]|uniref:Cof-type HAD-IIB family hydrolase n=1 Tax=Allocoprobacillus halotolerans TaxID=2944914 RepID=A0ABY5HXT6_9FIRM|nr:HAD family hydrolase [Allocoprobacillus halotolerans]UTY37883.1 Cof-type HAD-IIB family hydrolase [Allocoprobacillus halotolerans]